MRAAELEAGDLYVGRTTTVLMPLLDEGTDVWRPVQAEQLTNGRYRIVTATVDGEEWKYPSGSTVRGETKTFADGTIGIVIVGEAE